MVCRIGFRTIPGADRIGLPPHGVMVMLDGCGEISGQPFHRPFFSVAMARMTVKEIINEGLANSDEFGGFEKDLADSGLPQETHRFDRIILALGFDDRTKRIIRHLAGALLPDERSSSARFEMCMNAKFCGFENCGRYGRHGVLFYENAASPSSEIAFSYKCAMRSLEIGTLSGFFTEEERTRIAREIDTAGIEYACETRADRIVLADKARRAILLDIAFGITVPEKPARFEPCGDGERRHFHLFVFDEMKFAPEPVCSQAVADAMLDDALEEGVVDKNDVTRIRGTYDALGMPKPTHVEIAVNEAYDKILEAFREETRST